MKRRLADTPFKSTCRFLCGPLDLVQKGSKPLVMIWGARDGENLFGF